MAKNKGSISNEAVSVDRDWQAESDANTLIRAYEIREDKTRLAAAIKFAKIKKEQYGGVIQDGAVEMFEDDDDGDE